MRATSARVILLQTMRLALTVLLAVLLAQPAFAEDPPGVVLLPLRPHHHSRAWYVGWGLILLGGASTLVGVGLTIREDRAGSNTGWALAGAGTLTWVAGALVLKLRDGTR